MFAYKLHRLPKFNTDLICIFVSIGNSSSLETLSLFDKMFPMIFDAFTLAQCMSERPSKLIYSLVGNMMVFHHPFAVVLSLHSCLWMMEGCHAHQMSFFRLFFFSSFLFSIFFLVRNVLLTFSFAVSKSTSSQSTSTMTWLLLFPLPVLF